MSDDVRVIRLHTAIITQYATSMDHMSMLCCVCETRYNMYNG